MRGIVDRRRPVNRPDLRLAFSSGKEIRCMLFTLAIRVEALRQKYSGGLKAFVETYGARCNRKLAFRCEIDPKFVDYAVSDLENNGLIRGEDFVSFDGISIARFSNQGQDVDLGPDWLKGFIQDRHVIMYYAK
jgi:hypothetical protein